MSDITYRQMREDDAAEVSALVLSGFDEYIAPEYTPQGVAEFRKYVQPAALLERVLQDHFIVVATRDDTLLGMIEMRQKNHVSLLFVAEPFQRQGVSRGLFDHAMAHAQRQEGAVERVTVNSSRYGVPAYEALGFLQTGPERAVNGIVFTPMAMRIEAESGSGT